MSRRLNVDRMRRYVARTTPDHRVWRIPHPVEPFAVQAATAEWGQRMGVKHPGWTAHLRTWDDPATDHFIVDARVRP